MSCFYNTEVVLYYAQFNRTKNSPVCAFIVSCSLAVFGDLEESQGFPNLVHVFFI